MNLPTIIVAAIVAVVFVAVIAVQIRNKKQGKTSCSCGCGGCALRESCHGAKNNTSENG